MCAYACVRACMSVLSPSEPVISLVHRDYWHCFEQLTHQDACGRWDLLVYISPAVRLASISLIFEHSFVVYCLGRLSALSLVVEQTRVCRKLLSAQGRGRYLLRLALTRKALPQLITHLLHTPRVLEVSEKTQPSSCFSFSLFSVFGLLSKTVSLFFSGIVQLCQSSGVRSLWVGLFN